MTSNQVLHVTIPTSIGSLEGILKPEEEHSRPAYVGLVCHPHPLYGGTMHSKVVFQVAKALQEQNIAALRFNFRGVGHSSGVYDEGRGEVDDARFALEFRVDVIQAFQQLSQDSPLAHGLDCVLVRKMIVYRRSSVWVHLCVCSMAILCRVATNPNCLFMVPKMSKLLTN